MVAEISNMQHECSKWYYHQQQQMQQQQQQQYQQQYFGVDASVPLWSTYGQPTYLQYQHQAQAAAVAYQQQQMQLTGATSGGNAQPQPIVWNNQDNINNSDGNSGTGDSSPPSATNSSGSEIGSPPTPASPVEQGSCINQGPYDWMKKTNYQPCPGKTRTKDKYRVVYTEHQRLELEKEFYSSKYITTNRKAELAAAVALSERQIKIWFQNRRAKERKMTKKGGSSELEHHDMKPFLDVHGVPYAPPVSPSPALTAMANLSLGNMSNINVNNLAQNLQPTIPSSAALLAHHQQHHQHPRINGEITAAPTAHHVQHPTIGMWLDSSHGL